MPILRLTTYFMALLLPFEALHLPGNLPLVRTLGIVCILGAMIDMLLSVLRGRSMLLKFKPDTLFALAFLIVAFFSIVNSENKVAGLMVYTNIVSTVLLLFFIRSSISKPNHLEHFLLFLCVGFIASNIIAYLASTGLISIALESANELRLHQSRFAGFLRNPNRYAYFALLIFWAGVILLLVLRRRKMFANVIIIICSILILMSMSRAVIIGLSVGWLALLFISPNGRMNFGAAFLALAAVSLVLVFDGLTMKLAERFAADTIANSGSSHNRLYLWEYTLDLIAQHPFWGVGLGSLEGEIGDLNFSVHEPHNIFLFAYLYFGLLGFLILLAMILSLVIGALRMKTRNQAGGSLVIMFVISMLIPGLFHTVLFWKPFIVSAALIVILISPQLGPLLEGLRVKGSKPRLQDG